MFIEADYTIGIIFPFSFPYDFMHLMFENTLPNMIKHWTNKFKGFDDAHQPWNLDSTVWSAIWKASQQAGSTIPSAYGPQMPNTPADSIRWTSNQILFWTQYLAPHFASLMLQTTKISHSFCATCQADQSMSSV
jgi:hypothetical protein